jgi:photosystem II stability/assembly factor-like uncharacterized protein
MKKLFIVFILMFIVSFAADAQTWTLQTGPNTGDINSAWAVDANVVWMCGPAGKVIRTTNGGTTWALANTGLTGNDFYTVAAIDANTCVVGAGDGGLWRTTNGGTSWTFLTLTPAAIFINVVHFFNATTGFAQGDPVGNWRYYITTDAGATWVSPPNTPVAVGIDAGWNNSYMGLDTGNIWWGTNNSKILKGSLRGPFTSAVTTGQPNSFGVAFNDINNGVACFQTGATRLSVNGGVTWTPGAFTPAGTPFALKGVPGTGYVWMGTSTNLYRSTNSGTSFTSQLTLPAASACYALTFVNVNLGWAGTQAGKIYKWTDVVAIDPQNTETPSSFALEQNYPNPFNPSTTIKYSVPTAGNVTVKIYNSIGVEVMTVVSKNHTVGNYVENVDMSGFASGIYFYSLTSANFNETKKMMLVK